MSHVELAECMGVNRPVGEGFSAWLTHTGLVETRSGGARQSLIYGQTPFGKLVSQYDPGLTDPGTHWVIHYYLATEHIERSEAWLVFINRFLSPGQTFVSEEFQRYFIDVAGANIENRSALKKDPLSVLYTYVQHKSLGQLGFLTKEQEVYVSRQPNLPNILVIGYLLFDWWERQYSSSDTLRFLYLCQEEGSLGRICQVEAAQVKQFVADLTNLGYLSFSETQHEPVIRLYHSSPHTLLEQYYQQR